MRKAAAYLAKHPDDKDSTQKELQEEQETLLEEIAALKIPLDRGTGGFEEAAGHPLLGTESHPRHRRKQRAAQEAAHQRSLAG